MPPKKATPRKKALPPSSAATQKAEEDLKRLANQAKNDNFVGRLIHQSGVYVRALSLIALMAVYCNASSMALSPVYGQIPAGIRHSMVVWSALFIGWGSNLALRRLLPFKTILLIPVVAAYIPLAQTYLFRMSGKLGAENGPAITEALTLGPLVMLSTACIADILEAADLSRLPSLVADAAPGMGAYATFRMLETISLGHMVDQFGQSLLQTRMGMELVLAATYSIMARSKLLILTVPAVLHAVFLNPHLITPSATSSLNATLTANSWSLVDRWESVTGYISVLDSHKDGFRVMRCDHSLLGGEWNKLPRVIVGEPVYSVFAQLEAVRLVELDEKVPDSEASALNIGLGIGTTPSALIAHGIDTTIVEIDPIVYDFAKKYFGLPPNHTAVIADAVAWSRQNAVEQTAKYDYIIHDVFTGGAEPIDLFTHEFLSYLEAMLKPSGVIAINYAGDFALPPLSIVIHTIRDVFPSCRVFREGPQPTEEEREKNGRDFDNVIVFCTKANKQVTFKKPKEADYLQSLARKAYLMPKHEVAESAFLTGDDIGILRDNGTELLAKWHGQGALGHWAVMREVLPDFIWESW